MEELLKILPGNASLDSYLELELKTKIWVEEVIGKLEFGNLNEWYEALKDGVAICKLFKTLFPNSIMVFNDEQPISFLRASRNIENFLFRCEEELHFSRGTLFSVRDLYNAGNIVKVIVCLARIALFSEVLPDYDGPRFTKKIADNLKTEFFKVTKVREPSIKSQLIEYEKMLQGKSDQSIQFRLKSPRVVAAARLVLSSDETRRAMPGLIKLQALARGRITRRLYRSMRMNANYRESIAREMLSTEDTYVANLTLLKTVFFAGMNERGLGKNYGVQPLDVAVTIILNFSRIILEKLKSKVNQWSSSQLIGDVFIYMSDFLKIYTQYVQDYTTCIGLLFNAKDDSEFSKYLKEAESNVLCHGLAFDAFLILPVQRIPRYLLLVTDLLRHTSPEHPDYINLEKAQLKLTDIGKHVNEKQKEFESLSKVIQISNLFGKQLTDESFGISQFIRSTRRFIKEGKVKERNKYLYIYLFNDLLLTATKLLGNLKLQSVIRVRHVTFSSENYNSNNSGGGGGGGSSSKDDKDAEYSIKISKTSVSDWEIEFFFTAEKLRDEWFLVLKETQQELKSRLENEDEYDTTIEVVSKWSTPSLPPEIYNALPDDQKLKYVLSSPVVDDNVNNNNGGGGGGNDKLKRKGSSNDTNADNKKVKKDKKSATSAISPRGSSSSLDKKSKSEPLDKRKSTTDPKLMVMMMKDQKSSSSSLLLKDDKKDDKKDEKKDKKKRKSMIERKSTFTPPVANNSKLTDSEAKIALFLSGQSDINSRPNRSKTSLSDYPHQSIDDSILSALGKMSSNNTSGNNNNNNNNNNSNDPPRRLEMRSITHVGDLQTLRSNMKKKHSFLSAFSSKK